MGLCVYEHTRINADQKFTKFSNIPKRLLYLLENEQNLPNLILQIKNLQNFYANFVSFLYLIINKNEWTRERKLSPTKFKNLSMT